MDRNEGKDHSNWENTSLKHKCILRFKSTNKIVSYNMSKFEPLFHKLSADRDHIYLIPSHSLGTWSRAEPTADNHQYLWNE